MRAWTFTVDGIATKRGARPGRGHMHSAPAEVLYEQKVAGAASDAGLAAGEGPVSVVIEVWPPDWRRRDLDRLCTAVFDGLKRAGRAALADDNLRVIRRVTVSTVAVDPRRPRIRVTVAMLCQHPPTLEPYACSTCGEVVS